MACIQEETLWEYLDGEIDANSKLEVEAHLALCPKCEKALRQLQAFDDEISSVVLSKAFPCFGKNKQKLEEVELQVSEYQPILKTVWRRMALFGSLTTLLTVIFLSFAFPVQGTNVFEPEFQVITYEISLFVKLIQHPFIVHILIILATFSLLFSAAKMLSR
jgi:anti-sigma factor RsiW